MDINKVKNESTTHRKCGKSRSYKCKVTATTCTDDVLKLEEHRHEIAPGKREGHQNVQQIQNHFESQKPTRNDIASELWKKISETLSNFPCIPDLQSTKYSKDKIEESWCGKNVRFVDRHFELPEILKFLHLIPVKKNMKQGSSSKNTMRYRKD